MSILTPEQEARIAEGLGGPFVAAVRPLLEYVVPRATLPRRRDAAWQVERDLHERSIFAPARIVHPDARGSNYVRRRTLRAADRANQCRPCRNCGEASWWGLFCAVCRCALDDATPERRRALLGALLDAAPQAHRLGVLARAGVLTELAAAHTPWRLSRRSLLWGVK